ncbi:MAG TPA: fumarylacetoacetate hydrolase family protein [Steroidobacteraceae bacterium]|jgi:2-keto-4-pentenoate hydratase/2-oxohepta-3-ene-1,7-dioic acid hydratase in catechol pathway|nr:fumarylacetoacetate hydrolase family protein [Steroidobacteraceae bacterium]
MTSWVRFRTTAGTVGFGMRERDRITVCSGDLFDSPRPSGASLALDEVALLSPCQPSKIVALWNNFHALAAKLGKSAPMHPLYLIKPSTSVIGPRAPIERPRAYAGKIAFEGELGIVIARHCHDVPVGDSERYILGYTCVNDVTAIGVMNESPDFVQWCRSKGYDTFGVLGPAIVTDFDWRAASLVTTLEGVERQRYPLSDMIFSPAELVSRISHDMSLLPGDVIACGTSIGVGSIPDGTTVEVSIEGIGSLVNTLAIPAGAAGAVAGA